MPNSRIKIWRNAVLPRVIGKRDSSFCVIAVDGAEAEPKYFEKFGDSRIKVKVLPTEEGHSQPTHILDRLKNAKQSLQEEDAMDSDEYWMVFDVDERDEEALKAICAKAKEEGFQVAISNPCFEFWLFLHSFDVKELDQSVKLLPQEKRPKEMKRLLGELSKKLGKNYYQNLLKLPYKEFRENVQRAVRRAKEHEQGNRKCHPDFPGSHVYKLVEALPIKSI